MPPTRLVSTYQRYKQDTNNVASWLASTALACGFPSDRLKYPLAVPKPSSSGRLKGKQRKEAKRAKQQQQGSQPNSTQPKHIIAVAEFVTLAKFIASSSSASASVPDSFIEALGRVISLRSSFRGLLAQEGVDGDSASDKTHDYFTKILDQVRTILKPMMPATQQGDLPLLNRFEALKLYEPSQAFLDAPAPSSASTNGQTPASNTSFETEQITAIKDLIFVWNIMMKDLNALRVRIAYIWDDYRVGSHFDAATAALATSTAIDLARSIMDEVLPLAESYGGCWHIAYILCNSKLLGGGMNPFPPGFDGPLSNEAFDVVRDTLVEMHALMAPMFRGLASTSIPVCEEVYNPTTDREALRGEERMQEDGNLLLRVAAEQMVVVRLLPNYPVKDDFLRGMKELGETGEVSFSLAFAAQVHLDIHHVLRGHTGTACKSLLEASLVFSDEINAYLDFHKSFKSNTWSVENDESLQKIKREIHWVLSDPIDHAKLTALAGPGAVPPVCPPGVRPHQLLSWSPVMAGLMLFRFRAQMWTMGMNVSRARGSILLSAHLYDAMQNEGLLAANRCWLDMDVAKTLFGHDKFYVGDSPKTRAEYMRKFCLSLGVSAAIFAPNRRKKITLKSRAGARCLEGDPAVSRMFFPRYLENSGQINWTPEHIVDIVSRSRFLLVRSDKPLRDRRQQGAAAAAAGTLLSPPELIQKLALSLHAESLELSFNYLRMHRECWMFLRAIREACGPVLHRVYTSIYVEEEDQLPVVVGWIFAAMEGTFGDEVTESLMRSCAGVINEMIKKGEGIVVCLAMRELGFALKLVAKEGVQGDENGEVTFVRNTYFPGHPST